MGNIESNQTDRDPLVLDPALFLWCWGWILRPHTNRTHIQSLTHILNSPLLKCFISCSAKDQNSGPHTFKAGVLLLNQQNLGHSLAKFSRSPVVPSEGLQKKCFPNNSARHKANQ